MAIVDIRTNNVHRPFAYRHEVPLKVLRDQFLHLEDEIDGFIKYRGYWYHSSDFMSLQHNSDLSNWDGYISDTYFSGIVIRITNGGNSCIMGRYYS